MPARIWPGKAFPLGASYDGVGVNFALFSEAGTRVDLCLFDQPEAGEAREVITLPECTAHVFHGFVPGIKPGQLYGYRVHGPYDPKSGLRFNPNKLLVDPYALALANEVDLSAPIFPYNLGAPDGDLVRCEEDSAAGAPK